MKMQQIHNFTATFGFTGVDDLLDSQLGDKMEIDGPTRDGSASSAAAGDSNLASQSGSAEWSSGAEMTNLSATTSTTDSVEAGTDTSTVDGSASSAAAGNATFTSRFAPAAEASFAEMSNSFAGVTSEVNPLISVNLSTDVMLARNYVDLFKGGNIIS